MNKPKIVDKAPIAEKGVLPSVETSAAVRALISRDGARAVADLLGISGQTVARLAGGLSVNRSTLELARIRLELK